MAATLLGYQRIRTVTVIPDIPTGLAEAFAFDVVNEMSETNSGQAFRHPLQNGVEGITDGTRLEPPEFSVTGLVTDTPIRYFLSRHEGAVALYEQIKALRARQIPLIVITSWAGTLTDRWPEVITGTHGASQGASIQIQLNFIKFNIVRTLLLPSQVDADVMLLGSQSVKSQPL